MARSVEAPHVLLMMVAVQVSHVEDEKRVEEKWWRWSVSDHARVVSGWRVKERWWRQSFKSHNVRIQKGEECWVGA